MSIVLIGYRGSGKSTVGRKLADRLWQPFLDTDEMVIKKAGKSIKEIFEQQGEPVFRELEAQAVREACKLSEHVIALGGGAVLREENRAVLKQGGHKVIYLRCDAQELYKRIQADPTTSANRPHLTDLGGSVAEITAMLKEREPHYRAAMTAELDVTRLTPEEALVHCTRLA